MLRPKILRIIEPEITGQNKLIDVLPHGFDIEKDRKRLAGRTVYYIDITEKI